MAVCSVHDFAGQACQQRILQDTILHMALCLVAHELLTKMTVRQTDGQQLTTHTHTATLYPHTRTHTHMLHLTDWSHEPWESNCLTFAVIANVLDNCRCCCCCCCICCRGCCYCYCCCDRLRCLCAFTVVYPEPLANRAFVSAASSLCICSSWPWPWPWALRIVFATCGFPFPRCTLFQLIPRQQQQQRRQ